jgi:hypothetical protein
VTTASNKGDNLNQWSRRLVGKSWINQHIDETHEEYCTTAETQLKEISIGQSYNSPGKRNTPYPWRIKRGDILRSDMDDIVRMISEVEYGAIAPASIENAAELEQTCEDNPDGIQ